MAARGEELFNSVGCTKCHSMSGENMYGPPLKFNLGQEITVIRKGSLKNTELDRRYIVRSMKDPDYEKLAGYQQKKMAKIELSSEAIESIADYLIYINTLQK
jgi:mono/diheme cytochrome c family protein